MKVLLYAVFKVRGASTLRRAGDRIVSDRIVAGRGPCPQS